MSEQTIRLKLENNGVASDVAQEAAKLIADYTRANSNQEANSDLIEAFIVSYASFSESAIEMLKDALITGYKAKHIINKDGK